MGAREFCELDDYILDAESVAKLLRCDVATVEEKTRRGQLPAVKFGRSWIYPRSALMQRLVQMALEHSAASSRGASVDAPKASRLQPMMSTAPAPSPRSAARLRRRVPPPAL